MDAFDRIYNRSSEESKVLIKNNLKIVDQILSILKEKGWSRKDLADKLGKNESEISKWLSGMHNLTQKTIAKIEVALGREIITTPKEAEVKYRTYIIMPEAWNKHIEADEKENESQWVSESDNDESIYSNTG